MANFGQSGSQRFDISGEPRPVFAFVYPHVDHRIVCGDCSLYSPHGQEYSPQNPRRLRRFFETGDSAGRPRRASSGLRRVEGNAGRECLVAVAGDSGGGPEKIPKIENSPRLEPSAPKNFGSRIPFPIVSCPRIEYIHLPISFLASVLLTTND